MVAVDWMQRFAHVYSPLPFPFQIVPGMALTFAFYDALGTAWDTVAAHALPPPSDTSGGAQPSSPTALGGARALACGALGGTLAKLAVYPLDTVKKRAQVRGMARPAQLGAPLPAYASSAHALAHIARSEGVLRGWYKGTAPSLLKAGASAGLTFWTKEAAGGVLVHARAPWLTTDEAR